MTIGFPLPKHVITRLAKSVLIPLRLTAGASASDADILKKIYESGTTALISNEEMEEYYENSQMAWRIRINKKRNKWNN